MSKGKHWTEKDNEYLREYWGSRPYKYMAIALNRTERAVMIHATRLGLGKYQAGGDSITYGCLAAALGIDSSYTYNRSKLIANGLPVYKKKVQSKYVYKIRLQQFWEWAETHKDLINWSKLEKNILGKEPEWLDERRKSDYLNFKERNRRWKTSEDAILKRCIKDGMTCEEIGKRINRTAMAVYSRCYYLYLNYPKAMAAKPWTEEEKQKAWELRKNGYSIRKIALTMDRSERSIQGKLVDMKNDGYREGA